MTNYIVKEDGVIIIKEFDHDDGQAIGLTIDMLLTRDEIVYDIVTNRLSEKDAKEIKAFSRSELISQHLNFGMWIRNSYALWQVLTNPLVEKNATPDSIKHPDNCSFEIMELVLQTLNDEYTPNVSFTEQKFDNAMEILGDN